MDPVTSARMRLDVLGAGPAYTDQLGAAGASYLVRADSTAIVLDLGQGAFPRLAATLEPSTVDAIFVSDKRRTQETAAPLAKRLGLKVQIADHLDTEGFMDYVRTEYRGDIVLIVSHSNTIAPLIDELHGSKNIPAFGADDFGELYIVTIPRPVGKVKTLRFHYGDPPVVELSQDAKPSFGGAE